LFFFFYYYYYYKKKRLEGDRSIHGGCWLLLIVTLFVLENYSIHETMTMRRKKSVGKKKKKKRGGFPSAYLGKTEKKKKKNRVSQLSIFRVGGCNTWSEGLC